MAVANPIPAPVRVLGTSVVPFDSYKQVLRYVQRTIETRGKSFCVAINPIKVHNAQRTPALHAVLQQADIPICDGVGVALAARLLHGVSVKRCTGVDLFASLISAAAKGDWNVFLLGASEESNAASCSRLRQRYPGLRIVGRQNGYFKSSPAVIRRINASGTDLLFVAMGSPRQEFWISQHREALDVPFCMGIGGTLDVISGRARRAPLVFRRSGTEFLYRLLAEPKRLRRQLALPVFVARVLKELILGLRQGMPRGAGAGSDCS